MSQAIRNIVLRLRKFCFHRWVVGDQIKTVGRLNQWSTRKQKMICSKCGKWKR